MMENGVGFEPTYPGFAIRCLAPLSHPFIWSMLPGTIRRLCVGSAGHSLYTKHAIRQWPVANPAGGGQPSRIGSVVPASVRGAIYQLSHQYLTCVSAFHAALTCRF